MNILTAMSSIINLLKDNPCVKGKTIKFWINANFQGFNFLFKIDKKNSLISLSLVQFPVKHERCGYKVCICYHFEIKQNHYLFSRLLIFNVFEVTSCCYCPLPQFDSLSSSLLSSFTSFHSLYHMTFILYYFL